MFPIYVYGSIEITYTLYDSIIQRIITFNRKAAQVNDMSHINIALQLWLFMT